MADIDLERAIERMPSGDELDGFLSDPVEALVGRARDRVVVDTSIELELDPQAEADEAAVAAEIEVAKEAARIVAAEGPNAKLTPQQRNALELFIQLTSRPALFVRDGRVPERPSNWPELATESRLIEQRIAGVGRLEWAPGGSDFAMGTGFLVGDRRVMTNNHVAAQLAFFEGRKWKSEANDFATAIEQANQTWADPEQRPLFNMLGEHGSEARRATQVTRVVAHHPDVDLAVLEIAEMPEGAKALPLATEQPEIRNRRVYVLGYPVSEPYHLPNHTIERILGDADALRTKRCSPGELIGRPKPFELHHDATTLGGSSGSAVIDFDWGHVIGLHFGGSDRHPDGTELPPEDKYNVAVPLWPLRDDPLLIDNGVEFG